MNELKNQVPPPYNPKSTKEKILYAAMQLIAENGSDGFSLNQIQRISRVPKGSIYHHFKDLEDICFQCYELIKVFSRPPSSLKKKRSLKSFLTSFGKDTLERTYTKRFHRLTMFFAEMAMKNPKFQVVQIEIVKDYQDYLAQEMCKYVSQEISREKVLEAAGFFIIVLEGLSSHRVLFDDPERMKRILPLAVKTVCHWLESEN